MLVVLLAGIALLWFPRTQAAPEPDPLEPVLDRALAAIQPRSPVLLAGLSKSQSRISSPERKAVEDVLGKDRRIIVQAYLNRYGEVRWHRDHGVVGKSFDEYVKTHPTFTDALEQSFVRKSPKARRMPGKPFCEVSVPLVSKGEVKGVLLVLVPA